jgi:acyl-CoA synthetase (AMP-forming)/AMP-acid ligase II
MILVPQERIDHYVAQGWWSEQTLCEVFLDTAARQSEALAVADPPNREAFCDGAPRRWTWSGLREQAGRWAALLHQRGLRKDDVIVMQLPNSVEMHAVYLACALSGIVVSPVPVQYRAHELQHVLAMTGARLAVTTRRVGAFAQAALWAGLQAQAPALEQVWALGDGSASDWPEGVLPLQAALDATAPWDEATLRAHMRAIGLTAHDVLTLCWTSGTEAQPKGVPRNHNEWRIVGQSVIDAGQLRPGARLLIPFPFVNMAGVSTSLAAWLLVGGELHQHHPFDLDVFLQQLREEAMDYTVAAPAVLGMLLKHPDKLHGIDRSRLKRVGSGGGPVAEWLIEQCAQQLDIEVVNYFGSNEGAALSSTPQDVPDRRQRAAYFPRVGVPGFDWSLSNARKIRTRLVDLDSGADITEPGRVGELRFAGPTIFSGYYRSPELSARAFDEQGFYRTGDLFEIAGERGQFYRFAGRHKDIVVRGGMNISSEEVENLLLSHPKVREAAVVGWPDEVLGERVCAVVVVQPGQSLDLPELVDHLRRVEQVAAFKLPERLERVEVLPRNPLGKVLKRELRARLLPQDTDTGARADVVRA